MEKPLPGTVPLVYQKHQGSPMSLAWSPDGKRIASGASDVSGSDNTVLVWDATNGGHVYTYRGHSARVLSVAWSPDGTRIASGSLDSTVQVWDATNGGHVYIYRGHSSSVNAVAGFVNAVAWSPDGKRIASAGLDKTVQVWQALPIETKASPPPEKKPSSTSPSLAETISTVAKVGLVTLTVTASIATIIQTLIVVQERWEKTHHKGGSGLSQPFPQPGKTDIYVRFHPVFGSGTLLVHPTGGPTWALFLPFLNACNND